jgi:transcriptional regulator with XRE-family HTH domain
MRGMSSAKRKDPQGEQVSQEVLRRIGRRLRAVRQDRGLSLAQVADAAGLSRGFLSQVELGDASASVSSLVRLAAALGIEVTSLFEKAASPLVRHSELEPSMLGGEGVVDYILTPADERRAQLLETHLEPGGFADTEMWTRGGELVICHVESGTLELRLEDERHVLAAGDTITFDPKRPHTWRNPSRRYKARVLWVDVPAAF